MAGEGFGALFGAFFIVFLLIGIAILVAWILAIVQAYKAGRSGWWLYLVAGLIPVGAIAATIAWFVYFKANPTKLGSSDLVL